ncbi:MAG: xanthine dehydrogenase family protein molybdopterin-binding subunit [Deltaproteobacteria bacterium]|nr:xanthine dehydrogenase family protein molybdopterin-binding subunit [Deltaproteobacteria bacterium]
MSGHRIIGTRVPKLDAWDKVTGAARYGHDLTLPGMLHGKILRSPHPHARIKRIDVRRAEALPGVHCVLTADRVRVGKLGFLGDHPVLKGDKVRCVRDEVAAVAATSEAAAEEACALIRVEYEPLPAVFDPLEAMQPEAPRIHESAPDNLVPHRYEFRHGDAERAIAGSAHVVQGTYRTQFMTHCCLEPCFALAAFDATGRLTMTSSTQVPYLMQSHLSRALGIQGKDVRVLQPTIGGAFGSKLDTHPYEVIAALLARHSGRPVRILYTREEEFVCAPTRQPMIIRMATGCDREGRLTGRVCEAILDNGAYTSWGATTPHIMLVGISSLYKLEAVSFRATCVYTNNPWSGAFRGYGNPQGTFANEQQMDELARKAGVDPVEFRIRNANDPNSTTPQGFRVTTCALKECLDTAATHVGWREAKRPNEGVGIAGMFHVGGGGRVYKSDGCGVIAKLDDFAHLTLITGATEIGTGSDTAMAMLAAEELGLPLGNISVINNDTDAAPWDVGIHASRTTFIAGNATLGAVREIRKKLLPWAAKELGCAEDAVEFHDGSVWRKDEPGKSAPIDKLVRTAHFREQGEMFVGQCFYDPPNQFQDPKMRGNVSASYSFAAHAVRVRVDPETGKVKILKFVAAHDIGKVINRLGLEGQIEGAIAQGIGYALTEQLRIDGGRVANASFLDYKMLNAADLPEDVEIHFIESADPAGPYGAKGVSEAGLIPTAAAIANAIRDATGVRLHRLPMSPESVLAAIRAGEQEAIESELEVTGPLNRSGT